ncbi:tRNA dihydrouridine synthase DusB [Cellulomonas marina]|uniref:Putative TIM-barrel protein, nifR3 family n=1 Tax=Cellulomonas marina TaxID=988821 RepID=A0A1I0YT59_9CELL|nr:tRNA dihydrouridine synthase DusB [Cellulomonas marina]GIG27518.1 tRNA dihydrouridine synthase DusB [Cellulomonas marina]SFB16484.1 putative TIM-barrel protein, nifR3 family [Cellulomonas marina]
MTTLAPAAAQASRPDPAYPPLRIGPIVSRTPVVLAPMAGVTNAAFRRLCREQGAGLYVAEMVTSRALVERNVESLRIIAPDGDFRPRSIQIYGVDPATVGAAVRMVVEEDRADHVDLNFGCPVPKVTRRGGGAVLPWKRDLFRGIITAAVEAARPAGVPVTVKMRKGVDDEHLTYVEAGLTAQEVGVAAVALHGRTAADHYSGTADWDAIATLNEAVTDIPVLGNGDIWSAEDALAMVEHTGVDGVVVGRGCQGRPWLFADLEAAFAGRPDRIRPGMQYVAETMRRHATLMCEVFPSEYKALSEMRKHMAWYLKGYVVGGDLRSRLAQVSTLTELDDLLAELDLDQPYPGEPAEGPRGRAGSPKRPALPDGWLDSRELSEDFQRRLAEAELSVSGG